VISVKKAISEDFSDISGGLNTAMPAIAIGKKQVTRCLNAIIREQGWKRSPGYLGLKATAMTAAYLKGLHVYERLAGTETLLLMSGGKLYSVNETNGAITELYNLTGAGEAWFANAYDNCYVCNGTKVVKVEGTTAYQVGLTAPTGASVAAVAGGTLPDGVYNVYVSYARKVSGANVLYSIGQSLGDVTLGTGSNTIRVTCANSADAQVNNKVIWIREVGGAIWYFYHETDNNTTTAIDTASDAAKNSGLLYSVEAAPNALPGALQGIHFFDNRLFGFINNILYWSDKASNTYKLDVWRQTATGKYPFTILSLFTIGEHLYLNTTGGIIRQPYGDVNSRYEMADTRWFYRFPRTVDYWGSSVIGVTNDGIRVFDGSKFNTFDFSKDIKPEIDKLYSSYSSDFPPCGKTLYRNTRTEYHLSFRDVNVSATLNNRHLILNLSSMAVYDENKYKVPWEEWEGGCSYIVNKKANTIYYGQSLEAAGQVFGENTLSSADRYVYSKTGTLLTDVTNKTLTIQSRDYMAKIDAVLTWQQAFAMAQLAASAYLEIKIREKINAYTTKELTGNEGSVFGTAVFDESTFSNEGQSLKSVAIKRQISGRVSYWIFTQTADDINFNLTTLILSGMLKKTRFT